MYRTAAAILALALLLLGGGVAERLHNYVHAQHDAQAADHDHSRAPVHHDDTNCATHAQLHLPLVGAQSVTLLVFVGLLVAFLTVVAAAPVAHQPLSTIDCRGPPALVA